MKAYGVTDKGRARSLNEDFYYLPRAGETFVAVADGMGGHAAGEVASFMAITQLAASLRGVRDGEGGQALKAAFEEANTAVHLEAAKSESTQGMGTTLTALMFGPDCVYLAHVGDSRAYRLREGRLAQISTDHSYVEELVRSGVITRQQARSHPKRNLITRCIGVFADIDPQIIRLDTLGDDVWFLCSDGLTNYVTDAEIEEKLSLLTRPWTVRLRALVDMALERGGADNITVVAVTGGGRNE